MAQALSFPSSKIPGKGYLDVRSSSLRLLTHHSNLLQGRKPGRSLMELFWSEVPWFKSMKSFHFAHVKVAAPYGARHPQGCVLVSRRTIWFCCWFWLQIQAGSALLWALTGCWYAWKSLACAPAGLLAKLHVGSSRLHSAGGAREPTWLLRGQTPVGNKGFSSSCLCWCLLAG